MYEITWIETGRVEEMSYEDACEEFGREEFHEILDGYLPHIIAVNLETEEYYGTDEDGWEL